MRQISSNYALSAVDRAPMRHGYLESIGFDLADLLGDKQNVRLRFFFSQKTNASVNRFCVRQYQDLLRLVLEKGQSRADRTGTGTLSILGAQTWFGLRLVWTGMKLFTSVSLYI